MTDQGTSPPARSAPKAKQRRKPGDGSVRSYETSQGTLWMFVASYRDVNDNRVQKVKRGFPNAKAANKARQEFTVKAGEGGIIEPSKMVLGAWLDQWLDGIQREPSTLASYRKNVRLHIKPHLGQMRLTAIKPSTLAAWFRILEAEGSPGGNGPLSARTTRYCGTILGSALEAAVEDGKIPTNPARSKAANPPSARAAKAPEMNAWTADELTRFLDWSRAEQDPLLLAWSLLARTGMRRGEALGLRWGDIDLERGQIAIRRSVGVVKTFGEGEQIVTRLPKTGHSRVVPIGASLVADLRRHKSALATTFDLSATVADAPILRDPTMNGPHHPERFSREWLRRMRKLPTGLKPIRLHDLRHTFGSILLADGEPVKVVSELLGHSTPMITLTVYQHVNASMGRAAADRFDTLIEGSADSL